jgi:hypothetical protein
MRTEQHDLSLESGPLFQAHGSMGTHGTSAYGLSHAEWLVVIRAKQLTKLKSDLYFSYIGPINDLQPSRQDVHIFLSAFRNAHVILPRLSGRAQLRRTLCCSGCTLADNPFGSPNT